MVFRMKKKATWRGAPPSGVGVVPYIAFEAGQLDTKIRSDLVKRLTEVSVEITGIPTEYFFVSIRELPDDSIAVGGKTVTQMREELKTRPRA